MYVWVSFCATSRADQAVIVPIWLNPIIQPLCSQMFSLVAMLFDLGAASRMCAS